MKVLQVSQPTIEGTAVVTQALTEAALADGHVVDVACPASGWLAGRSREVGAGWLELTMSRPPGPSDLSAVGDLRRLVPDYDLVVLHSSKAGALGRLATASTRSAPPTIFVPHGWSWSVSQRLASPYLAFEKWAARHVGVIVAVSEEEAEAGRDVLGDRAPIEVIRNGVDTRVFHPDGPRASTRVVVNVGRLCRQKGQDRLLRALAASRHRDFELRLVGDGPDGPMLRKLARELDVAGRVRFCGHVPPLAHLQSATLAVFPSRWEGLSLALLEAMACGTPCIASGTGAREALHGTGLHLDPAADEEFLAGLTATMDDLLGSATRLDEVAHHLRARAVEHFSLADTTRRHMDLWVRVAA
jgi:glycosyltransferase involved in cell wall biosynthesis